MVFRAIVSCNNSTNEVHLENNMSAHLEVVWRSLGADEVEHNRT